MARFRIRFQSTWRRSPGPHAVFTMDTEKLLGFREEGCPGLPGSFPQNEARPAPPGSLNDMLPLFVTLRTEPLRTFNSSCSTTPSLPSPIHSVYSGSARLTMVGSLVSHRARDP
ncbi:hypothetical protein SKAU_G00181600 [Synaphobranchus kaupii]|uniref:Uncharacterized protein n=1 Tax=Synaphobranchus kaupii TaxID=118154 RepID=A0A9Q1J1Q7_SYNKA|nr:hypothetical protein SKAU_G00181600 [Synaphobranchus kaupii]